MTLAFGPEETPAERKRRRDRERQAKLRAENRENVLSYKREWCRRNQEHVRATKKKARERNIGSYRKREALRYERNKPAIKERAKRYAIANREKFNAYQKRRYHAIVKHRPRKPLSEQQLQKLREYSRTYYRTNKAKCLAYTAKNQRERKKRDPAFAMATRQRKRVWQALKFASTRKKSKTMDLVGCTPSQLASHIESQFKEGMSWENRGRWHVDHILPLSRFDLTNEEHQSIAFHYTNLQPLWKLENLVKNNNLPLTIPSALKERIGSFSLLWLERGTAIRHKIACRSDRTPEIESRPPDGNANRPENAAGQGAAGQAALRA